MAQRFQVASATFGGRPAVDGPGRDYRSAAAIRSVSQRTSPS